MIDGLSLPSCIWRLEYANWRIFGKSDMGVASLFGLVLFICEGLRRDQLQSNVRCEFGGGGRLIEKSVRLGCLEISAAYLVASSPFIQPVWWGEGAGQVMFVSLAWPSE